jgi:hypothetical protein
VHERQRSQIDTVGDQQVEGDIGRTAAAKQQFVELRAPGVIEHDNLPVEHMTLWRGHPLK